MVPRILRVDAAGYSGQLFFQCRLSDKDLTFWCLGFGRLGGVGPFRHCLDVLMQLDSPSREMPNSGLAKASRRYKILTSK